MTIFPRLVYWFTQAPTDGAVIPTPAETVKFQSPAMVPPKLLLEESRKTLVPMRTLFTSVRSRSEFKVRVAMFPLRAIVPLPEGVPVVDPRGITGLVPD